MMLCWGKERYWGQYLFLESHERLRRRECEWEEGLNGDQHEFASSAWPTFITSEFQPSDRFGIKVFCWNLKIWRRRGRDSAPGWCCLWCLIVYSSADKTINVRMRFWHLEKQEHNNENSRRKRPEWAECRETFLDKLHSNSSSFDCTWENETSACDTRAILFFWHIQEFECLW